ncbi:MAG: hypothetical protein D6806_12020 [Deltaproteobacteria bacterium]|nr:MAG: hypothetical protein D6806_12020 [Deltaproteobacteria bacterium]
MFFLCALVVLASWIGLLIAAWRSGLVWFLVTLVGALWFPPVVIVYIVTHWREAKVPFLAYAAAYVAALMLIFL